KDVHQLTWWLRTSLPAMRATALAMIVVMLAGPVLHHRKTIGQLAKLWVFVDTSKSMSITDSSMDTGRKLLVLDRLGMLDGDSVKLDLPRATEALAEAQGVADRALSIAAIDSATWKTLTDEFAAHIEEARTQLTGIVETERLDRLKRELLDPVQELAR